MSVTPRQRDAKQAVADFLADDALRLLTLEVGRQDPQAAMLADVRRGLGTTGQKWLPPTYFYDQVGSYLFETITGLAEYYPTRAEAALLQRRAGELLDLTAPRQIAELGSGSSTKTRLLFDAMRADDGPLTYLPIDVSRSMLEQTATALVRDYPRLRVLGLVGTYEDALAVLPPQPDRLVLFLGGTLGNFSPAHQASFFRRLAGCMVAGNHLLVGFDRRAHAGKPADMILAAYDDAAGITARFNLNLLARLNRELGADFDVARWRHRAVYNAEAHQIEMYLVSLADQAVAVPGLDARLHFRAGETILTELSRKFDPDELAAWFAGLGLRRQTVWSDDAGTYGLLLLQRD